MPEGTPTEPDDGQEPKPDEGQEPEPGNEPDPEDKGPKQYPETYVRQLRKEAAQQRNRVAELEEQVQAHEDAEKTEQQKLADKLAAAEARANDSELKLLRFDVAREAGLDFEAAGFLTGTTREELEHRAEELGKLLESKAAAAAKPSTGFDGGARTPAPAKGKPEEEHNDFLMRAIRGAPQQ